MINTCTCCGGMVFNRYMYNNHLNRDPNILHNVPHNENIFSSGFAIQVCNGCGYGFYTKKISEEQLANYYTEEYNNWNTDFIKTRNSFDERCIGQFRFVKDIVSFSQYRKTLEIGAGAALPSIYINSAFENLTSYVIEPNPNFDEYYKEKGLIKLADEFPILPQIEEDFDYVHASHWLEHVIELPATIKALNQIMRTGGYLFLEVPNCTDSYYRFDIKDTPHLHFFTKESLELVAGNFGFELVKTGTYWLTFEEYYFHTTGRLNPERKAQALKNSVDDIQQPEGAWLRLLFKKTF